MNLAELVTVWTLPSVVTALGSGGLFGMAVGWISTNPAYSSGLATPLRVGLLAFTFGACGGLTFYAGQALGSYLSDDPNWYRVLSRFGLWIVFSVAIGLTTGYLVWRDRRERRRRAHDRVAHLHGDNPYPGSGDH